MLIDVTKSYNIKADGVTDNNGLMTMQKSRSGNKPHYQLLFKATDSKEVAYQDNRWLHGIKSYDLIGSGMKFKSLYSGNDEALQRSFWTGELLQTNTLEYNGKKEYVTADLIAEAKAGEIQITRLTSYNKLKSGRRVMIYAGNYADSGYPPPCYMEVRIITNISGKVITLDRPLEKNYPINVWDNSNISGGGSGLPRIVDVEDQWARFARFVGVTFTGNAAPAAQRLEIIRCIFEDGFYWPSESGDIFCEDTTFGSCEFDKLFNTWTGNHVIFDGSPNGGGSGDKIKLTNSRIYGPIRFNSRYVELIDNYIECAPDPSVNVDEWIPSLAPYPARNPVREYTIKNLTFSSKDSLKADHHIGAFPIDDHSMLVAYKLDGKNILTTDFEMVKQLEPGSRIFNEDGLDGGHIEEISFDGTYHVIKGDWLNPPTGIWRWCHVQNVIDHGGHQVLDGKTLWHGNSIRFRGNKYTNGEYLLQLKPDDFTGNRVIDVFGFVEWIHFFGDGNIEIQNVDPFETIPLNFTGRKWVKQLYLIGTGGDFDVFIKWKFF